MELTFRNPENLLKHRCRKYFPDPDQKSEEWKGFLWSVRSAGEIRDPVDGTKDGFVMDGWKRVVAARESGIMQIPYLTRLEQEAPLIFLESVMTSRSYTAEAKFYLLIPGMEEFVKSANERRLANLRNQKSIENPLIFSNSQSVNSSGWQELSERLGLSKNKYFRVLRAYRLLNEPACKELINSYQEADLEAPGIDKLRTLQALFRTGLEPKFKAGEITAWGIISHIAGALPELQQRKRSAEELQLRFWQESPFQAQRNAAPAWKKLSRGARRAVLNDFGRFVAVMPDDMKDDFLQVFEEAMA